MNYYERHLGDYARDTAHLSLLEHGAYTLLLDRYYATEQGIPAEQAHRLARARTEAECAAVDAVLRDFFTLEDGLYVQKRAQAEVERAHHRIETAKKNGRTGGRPRKNPAGFARLREITGQGGGNNPNGTENKPSGYSQSGDHSEQGSRKPDGLIPHNRNETQSKALQTPDSNLQNTYRARATDNPDETQRDMVPRGAGGGAEAKEIEVPGTLHTRDPLGPEFGEFAMATYPQCTGSKSWSTALHHAQTIVATGKATEDDLRRRLTGYRAHVDGRGVSGPERVYTPQNWFDHLAEDPPCLREWAAPPKRDAVSDEATAAWDRLIATHGAARDDRVQAAINAVGGWPRIAERTTFEGPKLRIEFCRAYDDARVAA